MIYFVEDDDNIRKLVCYALSKEGYEVKGFSLPGHASPGGRIADSYKASKL